MNRELAFAFDPFARICQTFAFGEDGGDEAGLMAGDEA